MALNAADLVRSPEIYPHALDAKGENLHLVRLTQADYRAASFLDARMLTPQMEIGWAPLPVLTLASRQVHPRPLRFIFHTGHVGSTLLSRLLDEVPGVLGLREPLPLRSLAQKHDPEVLGTLLRLWSRGFEGTSHVIVKATSIAGTLAPAILGAVPDVKAVYLHLKAEPYLATIIAGSDTVGDQAAFAQWRWAGIAARLKDDIPQPDSPGEYAALTFLAEGLARHDAMEAGGACLMAIDFEDLLADLDGVLASIAMHFGLPDHAVPQAALGAVMGRYSKSPDSAYSPELRTQILDEVRAKAGGEIRAGLLWLEKIAARHDVVAKLLHES
jgi:hypothetical protein